MTKKIKNNVVPLFNKDTIRTRVALLAKDHKNIVITKHAQKRMKERDVTLFEVQNALKHGKMTSYKEDRLKGEYKLKMVEDVYGRQIHVVVTVSIEDGLLIITTYEG